MKNAIKNFQPEISTLEAEGVVLAKMWKSICKADKTRFKKAIQLDGFDTRLGKLLQSLKSEGGAQISTNRLRDCNLHQIDRRRRSEALWFVENEQDARKFNKSSKKGFTSLSALQKAMSKASKAKTAKADKVDEKPSKEEVSDVGQSEAPKKVLTASDIALEALLLCEIHGVDLNDFANALTEQNEMMSTNSRKAA
tara:strand:+ start:241 stop:828 length:588 start_codon:yes stop_codon:yes gene_type:complete